MRTLKSIVFTVAASFFVSGISVAVAQDIQLPGANPACTPNPKFTVVDFSVPTTALTALKKTLRIDTLFRYYDHVDETISGKTLHPAESDAIIAAGLNIGVVFQHYNDNPAKFLEPGVGKLDAERALVLADENRQPFDTAIYFGIDGPEFHFDRLIAEYRFNHGGPMPEARQLELSKKGKAWAFFVKSYGNFVQFGPKAFKITQLDKVKPEMMNPVIETYFQEIKAAFAAYAQKNGGKSYRIGMYCTAAMCQLGAGNNWAEYFWLSPERRSRKEYGEFIKNRTKLNLVQHLSTKCVRWGSPPNEAIELDFNQVAPGKPEFGQWSRKRPG